MIELADEAGIAVLTMRHGRANALDIELCTEIIRRMEELRTGPAQAVVLSNAGGIFSAGVDLLRAIDGGPDYFRAFLPVLRGLYECIFFFPKPVVAAIGGHAVAGGCVLACTADRRLMARDAGRIGVTELLVGLPFPAIAFEAMRFVASPRYFQEIVFTAATYLPEAALARGLVDEIVAPEALRERAIAAARALAGLSPAAFALSKRQAREPVRTRLDVCGRETDLLVDAIWIAPDTTDRIRDYVARTFKKGVRIR